MKYFIILIILKSGKKAAILIKHIYIYIYIYKRIIKVNDFKEISKYYFLARLATLPNEQKIKIKLFNNSASYSVNEELIDLQTVKTMQYSPPQSSSVPIADTPVCNIIDDSIQDIPPVPVVDTPACSSNNSSIHDIPSPISDTVSPQQTLSHLIIIPTCIHN